MASEGDVALPDAGQRRLRDDGLQQRGNELAQEAPGAGPGQAAAAKRGEASSSSMRGSSSKIIR